MTKNTRFSPEVRQRAVRMVLESQGEYEQGYCDNSQQYRAGIQHP